MPSGSRVSYQVSRYGAPLERVEAPLPRPRGTEVLVRIRASGVCHSDLHYWKGGYELGRGKQFTLTERGVALPIVMGHEPLGEVAARGDAAAVDVGETRLIYPWIGCGSCSRCRAGRDNDCPRMQTIGLFRPGGYSTHVLVPHPRYLLEVAGIPAPRAATLACAGVTALNAVRKAAGLAPEDSVVVLGAGGVGLTAISLARLLVERPLVAVDPDPAKRDAALAAGADHFVSAPEPEAEIRELTRESAGAVLDFVGTPQTVETAFRVLPKGGRYVAVGLFGGTWPLPIPFLALRNISFLGSLVGTVQDTRDVIDLVRAHGIPSVPVSTRPLDEVNAVLEELEQGRVVGRVVLVP